MQYAAVFPLPVLALASMSLPSNARGMAFVWMRVGRAKPKSANARNIRASRMFEKDENVNFSSTKLIFGPEVEI